MSRLLCLLLLGLLSLPTLAASLSASVDRSRLGEGETVELTLESDDPTQFGKPDLTPLEQDFEVLGTRQLNSLSTREGRATGTTRWIVTLQPKQSGYVVIPPLSLGELQTHPLTLQVFVDSESGDPQKVAPIFIDTSVDQDTVYVQAQVVLTLRIYHSVSLYDDSSLTPLQIAEARVEPLGQARTYEKRINGVRHGVIELRYAIYPQRSGALRIPGLMFSATTVEQSGEAQPFAPRQGRLVRVKSPDIPLQVRPRPEAFPADRPWLPARALELRESWSPEPQRIRVGDSLTRHLGLTVDGLSSAQLPPLPVPQVDGLRRYPDQPQLSNQASERGLLGSREEREALVAEHSGSLTLPAVEVYWWNTVSDRLEKTTVPARVLDVQANPLLEHTAANGEPTLQAPAAPALWPWQLACGLLAGTTLLGFGLWWRARRQPAILPSPQSGPSPRSLLDDLRRTCQAGDPQASRQALDAWARQQPETLAEMAARFAPLSEALDGLNGVLYSETGQAWQGEALWKAIRELPGLEQAQAGGDENPSLPPLYPR